MNDVALLKLLVDAGLDNCHSSYHRHEPDQDHEVRERAFTLRAVLEVAVGDAEAAVVVADGPTAGLLRRLVRVEIRKARRARRNAEVEWWAGGDATDQFDPSLYDTRVDQLERLYRHLGGDPARIHLAGTHRP